MDINAKYFGPVSYEETDAIHIINGLIGFESHTKYLPIPFQEGNDSMLSLQCLDDETISFYVIGVIRDSIEESTVNLKAPLVVNTLNHKAKQVILEQPEYTFRHALGDTISKEG